MQFQISKDGELVGVIEAESEEAARFELSQEGVFGDAAVALAEVPGE